MYAILMVLALGAAPAAVERDDPELVAEEAKAIRKELITVRAELRRLKAREEALKVGRTLGLEEAEARERLMKDPIYLQLQKDILNTEAKLTQIQRVAPGSRVELMTREVAEELNRLKVKLEAHVKDVIRPIQAYQLEERRAYWTALEKLLLADLKRLTGR
jgi:hypothetical protein